MPPGVPRRRTAEALVSRGSFSMASPDTIFALSSGRPPAAIAVIRLSGPDALGAARRLTTRDLPPPRQAGLRRFVDPASGELLDEGLLICFPGDRTETGEPMAELHCHGSWAVVRGIEAALAALPGLRPAQAGEFTRRAFLNGRTDLAAIEGLGDLLAAETALQRRTAMAMMAGQFSQRISTWTQALTRLAAQVEARLDFADEDDVSRAGAISDALAEDCGVIARDMESELARPGAERMREGIRVAIGGPPNAGKSTLFNYLVGREAAIVSPHAGTTRDVIEATISLNGIPIILADTAGLREDSSDEIERIGISRASAFLAGADVILWLGDPADRPGVTGYVICVQAKADLGQGHGEGLAISAISGEGMDQLIGAVCAQAMLLLPVPGDYALSQRQREIVGRAALSVGEAGELDDEILVGECLRQALAALDELTGRSTTDAVLDEVFSGFCIGK